MYRTNINATLTVENVIQIKSEIMIDFNGTAKNIIHARKIIFGTLLHVAAKMVNI